MKPLILFLAIFFKCAPAHAINWICSTPSHGAPLQIGRAELRQAYSGQPVLLDRQWLMVVMLPADHPDTRRAFSELGISAEAAERMASGASLIDRGIRVVRTTSEMLEKVGGIYPAAGYMGFFPGGGDVEFCF